jgi:hypothetical protein
MTDRITLVKSFNLYQFLMNTIIKSLNVGWVERQ